MELTILLRLLTAHFLGDFLLQPTKWVLEKNNKKAKAPALYYHVLTVAVLTYLAVWDWSKWYIPLIVFISHLLIDIWKSHQKDTFVYFFLDQLFHLLVIFILWLVFYFDRQSLMNSVLIYLNATAFWALLIAYYFVIGPLGIAIGIATKPWRQAANMEAEGLNRAGLWIGRCERLLILTFILANQYTALGFLMASKSILRFSEKENRQQKKTEYILVGTLISFASAALIGMIVRQVLKI